MFYVLSLGGSIVSLSDGININFLIKFKKLIENRVRQGDLFIIVVGGGSIARQYVKSLEKLNNKEKIRGLNNNDKDWLGIHATRLNACLVKSVFSDLAFDKLVDNPSKKIKTNKPLIFSGGYFPGNSSDLVAVFLAETYGIKEIINLSNIDYVYDRDPRKFADAKKLKQIDWRDFLSLIGEDWRPGMNAPFDPVASKRCKLKNKKVVVLNGQNIKNLEKYFSGQKFKGTVIN